MTVRPIDLDHVDDVGDEVAGQAGAVATCALDTGQLELTERARPSEQVGIAGRGRVEAVDVEQSAALVECGSDVDVEVGVDTDVTTPAGTADKTAMGLWTGS